MTADSVVTLSFYAIVCITAALTAAGVHVGPHAVKQLAQSKKGF